MGINEWTHRFIVCSLHLLFALSPLLRKSPRQQRLVTVCERPHVEVFTTLIDQPALAGFCAKTMSRAMSDSSVATIKKEDGYDPTTVPLPSDAVRAGPGDRQIAYPYVELAVLIDSSNSYLSCSPKFPRAKINGTPDGMTSVHIGVRPRQPEQKEKRTPSDEPAFPNPVEIRNAGKGKAKVESRVGTGRAEMMKRIERYGEVKADKQDGSSTAGSDLSDFASARNDLRQESSRHATSARRSAEKQKSSNQMERAVPRMTLKEAVEQWDKNHPQAKRPSSNRDDASHSMYSEFGNLEDGQGLGDDGRSHDGIYTYDYSGSSKDSARVRSKASSSNLCSSKSHSPRTVVHVDGTEGPVRIYPRPPEHENSYGVPFGKRLKALIQMRKEAEENGLVVSSLQEDAACPDQREIGVRMLVRRSAVMSRESARNHAKTIGGPGKAGGAKLAEQPSGTLARGSSSCSSAPGSDSSDATPTRQRTRAAAPSPQTPSKAISHRLRRSSPTQGDTRSISGDFSTNSTISALEPVASKPKRKPVPRYDGEDCRSPLRASQTNDPCGAIIRKQKSESSVKKDVFTVENDRRGHQRGSMSPEKRQARFPIT